MFIYVDDDTAVNMPYNNNNNNKKWVMSTKISM
jgi:hypothetical protein